MNYPDQRIDVLILNPNNNNWEIGYYKNNQWWQGVDNDPNDKLCEFIPLEWRYIGG